MGSLNFIEDSNAPSCSKGHKMVLSTYDGAAGGYRTGYVCDRCFGRSSRGHLEGSKKRWFCRACWEDYCIDCVPEKLIYFCFYNLKQFISYANGSC